MSLILRLGASCADSLHLAGMRCLFRFLGISSFEILVLVSVRASCRFRIEVLGLLFEVGRQGNWDIGPPWSVRLA